jgi:hypothetical protein
MNSQTHWDKIYREKAADAVSWYRPHLMFSLSTGHVFGTLQSGPRHPETGHVVHGLAKAEPIYPLFDSGLIDKLLR